jgi:hypothetical protein
MADDKQKTQTQIIQELTEESRLRGYVPFPKWLYHPDGRSQVVNTELEQTALGGEWLASPQEALDEKAKRDKRDSDAFIAKANAEAAAAAKKGKQ